MKAKHILFTIFVFLCSAVAVYAAPDDPSSTACTITIQPTNVIDGRETDIQPGAVVCLAAGDWGKLDIQNVAGTPDQRVMIRNAGGQVNLSMLNVYNSQHLRILGNGADGIEYGLLIDGKGHTVKFRRKTEYLEFAHAEIASSNGIALNAKTQATCPDGKTGDDTWDYTGDGKIDSQDAISAEYVVHDLHFHHLFVRQAGSEALYVGSNDTEGPARDLTGQCSPVPRNPLIDGVHIHDSVVQDFGRDGINIKGTRNGLVERNTITGGSTLDDPGQNGAIKISQNASVDILDNTIDGNRGPGIGYIGTGGNTIARNTIKNVGGMFAAGDEKGSGIWVKPTGGSGPMVISENTVEGSAAWGVHVTGAAQVAANTVGGSGNDALNVPQAEQPIRLLPGETPTVAGTPMPTEEIDTTPAGEAPTAAPSSTAVPYPTFPPLPTFSPPITLPVEPTPEVGGAGLPETFELCLPSGECATYQRVDGENE